MGKKNKDWAKYGSTFDPSSQNPNGMSGKIQMPQSMRDQAHREANVGGCGNPQCNACNPETAQSGAPAISGRRSAASVRNPSLEERNARTRSEIQKAMAAALARAAQFPGSSPAPGFERLPSFRTARMSAFGSYTFDEVDWDGNGVNPNTPHSYDQAREAVAKWIHKAPEQSFDDIVGNDEALEQIRDAIQAPVLHKDLYAAYGMKMPKGALLSGPPGCGKTMFARAAASEMRRLYGKEVEFISISGSELQSPYVGVTEGHIKAIFTFAREYKAYHKHPLLVFMDEADAILPDRTGRIRKVASWEESNVATFLAEMDGIHESGAFVMIATNRPEVIDQAVLRDGRCDFKIVVKRPTQDAIETIIRRSFTGVPMKDTDVETLVFTATECLFDPARVIAYAHAIGLDHENQKVVDRGTRDFLLEHIVSGAMATSIPGRAKRHAFARDKATGIVGGVTVEDVIAAVGDLYEENKGLDHSFALEEFKSAFHHDLQQKHGK